VEADLGPDQHWAMDVMLADPTNWAMVTVLAVDGQVVATNEGPRGALCSMRNW
jgi:hypothetical protein